MTFGELTLLRKQNNEIDSWGLDFWHKPDFNSIVQYVYSRVFMSPPKVNRQEENASHP